MLGWKVHGDNTPEKICHSIYYIDWNGCHLIKEWKKTFITTTCQKQSDFLHTTSYYEKHPILIVIIDWSCLKKVDEKRTGCCFLHENISHYYPMIVPTTRMWGYIKSIANLSLYTCLDESIYASTYFTQMYGFSQDLAHTQLIQRFV